ncbi:acyltransferase family protein [Parvularcula sp. ZS-1/3]|uniref:Acyltransferase family protein n=1 Tax=Parvularcula mediterranea TaxID=2732508 RepID=A0A7Y3RMN2_9PROT|nr:acyltransferase family protein [Parvularcula mediterranea]NNU16889.1 acyltransferase family protein [Parvularcula mediterranea]
MVPTATKYRSDIDGLRAIAVLLVIFFHAGFKTLSGGFVGVDVFFVISGFLITRIIASEIDQKSFSFANFYLRRARRLLPAFYGMLLVTLIVGAMIMLPSELEDLGETSLAAIFFSSNVYFWQTTGYFTTTAEFNPLLHMWSLSVEEQFYIVLPPLMLLLFALKVPRLPAFWVMAVGSLLISAVTVYTHLWGAYFLLPSRAWQLLAGGILGLHAVGTGVSNRTSEGIGWAGLAAIMVAAFGFDSETRFPGLAALLPTLGAVAMIHAGGREGSALGKLLGHKVLVTIGLASYSLYLWHWPVLAYIRLYNSSVDLPLILSFASLVPIFGLGFLSWRFIEQPFRKKQQVSDKGITLSAIAASLVLVGGASVFAVSEGLPGRIPPAAQTFAKYEPTPLLRERCMRLAPSDIPSSDCFEAARTSGVLLWGDSHGAALAQGRFDQPAFDFGFIGTAGCPPLLGAWRPDFGNRAACTARLDQVAELLETSDDIDTVLIASRWPLAVEGTRMEAEGGSPYLFVDQEQSRPGADNPGIVARGLARSIAAAKARERNVVLIGPVPEVGVDVPKTLARREIFGSRRTIEPAISEVLERQRSSYRILCDQAETTGARLVFPHLLLCSDSDCRVREGESVLYVDDDHVSKEGAHLILERISDVLEGGQDDRAYCQTLEAKPGSAR